MKLVPFSLIGYWNPAITVTMLGVSAAVTAVLLAGTNEIAQAWVLIVIAGLADLFDGPIARRLSLTAEQKNYGVQIDSLADVVNFGVTPVIILLAMKPHWICLLVGLIYLTSAIARLAWFNIHSDKQSSPQSNYTGLPVTYAALVLPLFFLLSIRIDPTWSVIVISVAMLVLAILFVLRITVPKPRGIWYIIFPIIACVTIGGLLWDSSG